MIPGIRRETHLRLFFNRALTSHLSIIYQHGGVKYEIKDSKNYQRRYKEQNSPHNKSRKIPPSGQKIEHRWKNHPKNKQYNNFQNIFYHNKIFIILTFATIESFDIKNI